MNPDTHHTLTDGELLFLITSHIQEVFWVADPFVRQMVYISPGYERVWGRSRQSLMENPRSFLEAIHPDDLERVLGNLAGQPDGIPFDHEYRVIKPDGTLRWVWDRGEPIRDAEGSVRLFVGAALDITRLKTAEAQLADANAHLERRVDERTLELEETRRRLELAAQAAGVGFWEMDIHTQGVTMDHVIQDRMGYPQRGPGHKSGWDLVHPDDKEPMKAALLKLQQEGKSRLLRFRSIRANGSVRQIECGTLYIPGQGGTVGRVVGASRDITEEVERAERLQQSEEYNRAIFEVTPNPTVVVDDSLRISRCNPAFLRFAHGVWETPHSSPVNEALSTLLPSDACARLQRLIEQPPPAA